jgi:hypothetical protein
MEQKVGPLSLEDAENLDGARNWLKEHFTEHAEEKYAALDGKLRLLETILHERWLKPDETSKLQSLGVAFGDALVQKLGMEWVIVEDEFGRTPSVCFRDTKLMAYPLTAISKRIEDGEDVNVYDLFELFCQRLATMKAEGWT